MFIWFIRPFAAVIQWISPAGPEVEVISRQIANAHTMFNLVMTIIWTPLLPYMVKIVTTIVRESARVQQPLSAPVYLDSKLTAQPAAALRLVEKETVRCGEMTNELLADIAQTVRADDEGLLNDILKKAANIRKLNEHISEYLTELFSAGIMSEEQANEAAGIMYLLSDFDRIALLCAEMTDYLKEKLEKKYKYSKEAMKDLEKSFEVIEEMYQEAFQAIISGETDREKKIRKKKEKVLELSFSMRKAHLDRVSKGKCSAKLTKPFQKMLNTLDRISNSCVNIADTVAGKTL